MKQQIAVYPGSFDPITKGHISIIKRTVKIFDKIVVAVLSNRGKKPLFTTQERIHLIKESVNDLKNVEVDSFSGLLTDYMKKRDIQIAIRGLRAVSDLDYEFQLAHTNRSFYPQMETVFFMPSAEYVYLSSSMVREAASYGSIMKEYLPLCVCTALKNKFRKQ